MENQEDRLNNFERELEVHSHSLTTIQDQLARLLTHLTNAPPLPPAPPQAAIPLAPTTPGICRLKPASPSEFDGNRAKGRAFLNSCDLYMGLAHDQFHDDSSKIYWALSFMKGDRAARFTDRVMRTAQSQGQLPYHSWEDFRDEFVREFCPKNESQAAHTELETTRYFQGS
jgi:hypothetical protein